ncbi:MAG: GNAT family N-acetyltransferase [Coriobacteriales bacterium]|jgi:GNAT superfamily N-acetyltransferase|nr:GNAT family N-acetyltransferase [Coriobacteriales bacterium]
MDKPQSIPTRYLLFLKSTVVGGKNYDVETMKSIICQVKAAAPDQEITYGILGLTSHLSESELSTALQRAIYSHFGDCPEFIIMKSDEVYSSIAPMNLFMMCTEPNISAFCKLPEAYSFRLCRPDELLAWKQTAVEAPYIDSLTEYFETVYAKRTEEFFQRCTFVVDSTDYPVATCFIWPAYQKLNTLAFLRVLPGYEGLGLGRALLSELLANTEYPVYLHTHPTSYRAIRLYSQMAFKFVDKPVIGDRDNNLYASLPFLKAVLPERDYQSLVITIAPDSFVQAVDPDLPAEF